MPALIAISSIWVTVGPIIAINAVLFVSYLTYQLWGRKHKKHEFEGAKTSGSKFLSSKTREWWFWTTDPIVKMFVKMRMGPNAITAAGLLLSVVAAYLFSRGWFGYAGWTMILAGSFDMFDGRVARITGQSSRSGAFFDAVMDRFGEGICFLGLGIYFRSSFMLSIVIAGLIGSLLVSYTKARAEGIGVECDVGAMQRPERIVYLGVASAFDPIVATILVRWWALPPPLLVIIALCFIAIMTNATAIYRMVYVMNSLDTADRRERESIPQIISKLTTHEGREELLSRARYGYDRTHARAAHIVLFLMGGISPELFYHFMKRGDLPNIASHIAGRGGIFKAVGAFPSATGPAAVPFVTGAFPGTCDIPGTRWFDRTIPEARVLTMNRFRDYLGWGSYAMDHDLSKSVRTIFEYSRQAVNIFGMLNRGCGIVRDPAFFSLYKRFHRARSDEDIIAAEEAAYAWFTQAIKRETDFVLYHFPPIELAEMPHENRAEYMCQAIRRIDDYVGRAAEFLKSQGMYNDTAMVFAGTRGQGEAIRRFDLERFLSKRHKTFSSGKKFREWYSADMISLISGTSMAHVYMKSPQGWGERVFIEDVERSGLIGSLLEEATVDVIAGRSMDGGIIVQSRRGRAHMLEDADGRITYMVKGSDPFGLVDMPRVTNSADSFSLTHETGHPDCIAQILQLFRSRRTGDVVISAEPDVSLKAAGDQVNATSGSLAKDHLIVPVVSSVDFLGRVHRTADVFSLILEMMGIEPEHSTDGILTSAHGGLSLSLGGRGRGEGETADMR